MLCRRGVDDAEADLKDALASAIGVGEDDLNRLNQSIISTGERGV